MNTHYMVLQVTENAWPEVIEAAWKALMKNGITRTRTLESIRAARKP